MLYYWQTKYTTLIYITSLFFHIIATSLYTFLPPFWKFENSPAVELCSSHLKTLMHCFLNSLHFPVFKMFHPSSNTARTHAHTSISTLKSLGNFCSRDFLFHKEFDDSALAKRHIVVGHFVRSDTDHVMQALDVTRHSRITQQLVPSTTALSFVCCSQFACKKNSCSWLSVRPSYKDPSYFNTLILLSIAAPCQRILLCNVIQIQRQSCLSSCSYYRPWNIVRFTSDKWQGGNRSRFVRFAGIGKLPSVLGIRPLLP